jgi:hypothetical protein
MGFQHKTYEPCGARCKRTGEACQNPIVTGSTRCRLHGGKTPKGAAASQFSHGYYSKDPIAKRLWASIQRNYRAMLADERGARWLATNPRPNPNDFRSARAFMAAGKAWFAAYGLAASMNHKTDVIPASEAQACFDEYCELVGSRDFWDVYLLAVYSIRIPRRDS